jgi:hypothetical protein
MYTKINFSFLFFLLVSLLGPAGFSHLQLLGQTTRASTQKEIRIFDPVNPANGNIGLRAASGTAAYTMILPSTLPSANQLLRVTSLATNVATLGWVTSLSGTGTGADGQVTYWTSGSSQAGSNNLFWNNGSERLGIGTASPGEKLSINEPNNADLDVSMTARGGKDRKSQLTFGVKSSSSNNIGGSIGTDGDREGGLILNGTTNNIKTSAPQVYISPTGELHLNPTFTGGGTLTDNGNYRLQINGDLYANGDLFARNARFANVATNGYDRPLNLTSDGTLTTATSDIRLKKNIETIPEALEKVMSMRGVTYNWKDSTMPKRMMGMIAQEVLRVAPELVFQNERNGYYGINYGETSGLLIEAIKTQQKTIQELSKSLAKQGQEMMVLLKEVNNLKQQLKTKL